MYILFIIAWLFCGLIALMIKAPRIGDSIAQSHGWGAVNEFITAALLVCLGPFLFIVPKR